MCHSDELTPADHGMLLSTDFCFLTSHGFVSSTLLLLHINRLGPNMLGLACNSASACYGIVHQGGKQGF